MQTSRHLFFCFPVLLLAGLLIGAQLTILGQTVTPNSQAAEALQRARTAYRQRDFDTARKELQQARTLQKDWAEPVLLEALIAWQEHKNAEAIKSAKEALQFQPTNHTAHYLLARLYFEGSKYDDAQQEAQAAIRHGAQFADAYVLLGDIEIFRHKAKEALAAYETALLQPAPKNEVTPELRLRLEALRNLLEFIPRRNDPRYEWPKMQRQVGKNSAGGIGTINLAGVVTEQGQYINVLILSADVGIRGKEGLLEVARQYQFTPARKDGKPVPFWMYFSYSQSTMTHR